MANDETNGNGEGGDHGGDDANPHRLHEDLGYLIAALDRWRSGLVWLRRSLPTHRDDLHGQYNEILDKTTELGPQLFETFEESLVPRLMRLRDPDAPPPPPWLVL